jgi:hypothetical protein
MHQTKFWDGYLDLARRRETVSGADGQLYEPLFVRLGECHSRLVISFIEKLEANGFFLTDFVAIDAERWETFTELAKEGFFIPNHWHLEPSDFAYAVLVAIHSCRPLEYFVYQPLHDDPDRQGVFWNYHILLDVGAPANARQNKKPSSNENLLLSNDKIIAGIIDNDIGFLNRRFQNDDGDTRFLGIWLQAREQVVRTSSGLAEVMQVGLALNATQISELAKQNDERGSYHRLNAELHHPLKFQGPPRTGTHGTAVADLAYGADPDEEMAKVPLLAVQLPPEAAEDTSGTYSESYIVQGMRWLIFQTFMAAPRAKLVVNISFGALAGQKDGGKFLEAQIAGEIENAKSLGIETKVVFAFGNSFNSRQVAKISVGKGAPASLKWAIQPNNPAPSFLEVRALVDNKLVDLPEDIQFTLISPTGGTAIPQMSVAPETAWPNIANGEQIARIYHVPNRDPLPGDRPATTSFCNLAIAPTIPSEGHTKIAIAGEWTLICEHEETVDLVLQIQRGDTAPGFGPSGQQSFFVGYFEDAVDGNGHKSKTVTAPLTNEGTNSAYTTSPHPNILTAGALRQLAPGQNVRASYSSQGALWAGTILPDNEKVVDGLFNFGRKVTGTYSGSHRRLSGTSAAAALVSRDLVDSLLP